MDKNFKVLLDILNDTIAVLNNNNRAIFDYDNTEFYISEIVYDSETDKIYFKTEEEKK